MENSFLERQLTDRFHIKKFKSMNSEKLRFRKSPSAYHVEFNLHLDIIRIEKY